MCGRFTLRTPANLLIKHFQLSQLPDLCPRFNIAPTQSTAVVRRNIESGQRECVRLRWGLIPSWAKDPAIGNRMINARAESVASKPSFRSAFRRRRCLVLADGYYEWQKRGGQKQPYYIRMAKDRPFAMAGLWEQWSGDPAAKKPMPEETFAIITTPASKSTREVHDRMPAILGPEDYDCWLDPQRQGGDELLALLAPFESDELVMDPVSTHVNSPRNDDPTCIQVHRELF
jgi:putative SOS response-associated peptidase YedK